MSWKSVIAITGCLLTAYCAGEQNPETVTKQANPMVYGMDLSSIQLQGNWSQVRYCTWGKFHLMVLSDDSIWAIHPLQERTLSLCDVLCSTKIVQPRMRFITDPANWNVDVDVNIYKLSWRDSGLGEIYEFDQSQLIYCSHMIENVATKEVVFARKMKNEQLVQVIDLVVSQAKEKSYLAGVTDGFRRANEGSH